MLHTLFQEGILHLELAYALPRIAQLAVFGLLVGPARELAAAVLDPLPTAFELRPSRGGTALSACPPKSCSRRSRV